MNWYHIPRTRGNRSGGIGLTSLVLAARLDNAGRFDQTVPMPLFYRLPRPQTLDEAWALLAAQAQEIARLQAENSALRAENAALRAEGETLRALVGTLQAQVQELTVRLGQNSSNSSKPPSSDPPHRPPRPPHPPSGRAPGGQPGHRGQTRAWYAPERVDQVVEVVPAACARCGSLLLGADADPERHQVTELPVVRPTVVEYRRHTLICPACNAATAASWPSDMPTGAFGPRVQATVGYLTGRLGVSQRDTAEALAALCGVEVSLGSIPALEQAVSAALAGPVAEAEAYVQQQSVANVDETGWRQGAARAWLWVGATGLVTVFQLLATRGAAGAKRLLGEAFGGIVGSDRWAAYTWVPPERRQVCWAHLRRDFQALVDWGGPAALVGTTALALVERLFAVWRCARNDPTERAHLAETMAPLQAEFRALFEAEQANPVPKAAGLCRALLKLWPALWTFVRVEDVEPTNNAAERPLRRAVLWRRRSFGTQSEAGSRFVERVLTAVTTLRQQQRDVLAYLTAACAATMCDTTPPSLLPAAQTLTPPA